MNIPPENIIVNSCEYTPVYLIPSTSVTQGGSYILAPSNHDVQKPVTDNLKTFYEKSGNLESSLLSSPKPRILKKQSANVVGNNLKLASFLLPKSESSNVVNVPSKQVIAPVTNVIVKPVVNAVTTTIVNGTSVSNTNVVATIPRVENVVTTIPRVENVVKTIPRVENVVKTIPRVENVVKTIPRVENVVTTIPRVENVVTTLPRVENVVASITRVENNMVTTTIPRVEIDRKIVRVGTIPTTTRTHYARALPKNKPKEKIIDPNPSKHTSVQLIKLGETYHSLNQLSDDQMKIVNKALKMFSDPEKIPKEPAYDPVTNTKFIYKVVSPKDLTVVGRNKMVVKKKNEVKRQKLIMPEVEPETPVEPKVTRSGRTVKLPKQMRPGVSPQRPKKKVGSVVNCFQCSAEFCSFYRLQRHYEMYPTHIPARIHSNLFHCLLAIIKGGGEDDQANIFIQQLEQLIEKIKTLLPCLLKKIDGKDGKLCTVNDDIGRLFGMNPGKYNFNMDAMTCVKDKDGNCIHNPAPKTNHFNADVKPSQMWLSKHNEEIANNEAETEDCARINSVDKWPTVTKRIWKLKQQKQKLNAKKMRLTSENDQPIELVMEDVAFSTPIETPNSEVIKAETQEEVEAECEAPVQQEVVEKTAPPVDNLSAKLKTHAQFHSAHFDIRSSPIKLPSALARKFQFNPDKLSRLEVEVLRPLAIDRDISEETETFNNLPDFFRDNEELPKESETKNDSNFDTAKNWVIASNESSHDSFIKSTLMFEPSLTTPEKNGSLIDPSLIHVDDKVLFEPSPKTRQLIEANLLQIHGSNELSHSLLHANNKGDSLFGTSQSLLQTKNQPNGYYEPSSIHVKPKCNSLIGSSVLHMKDKSFELALSHVKDRSNNLFESALLQPSDKSNSIVDSLVHDKEDNTFFDTSLMPTKERSNNLFDTSLIGMKDKDSLLDPVLLLKDSSLFGSVLTPSKDHLIEQSLVHSKGNSLIDQSFHDHNAKNDVTSEMNIDVVSQSDALTTNDSRLLSSQGQSVLNFLESLGNESLGLSYPETEIRNNSVDFQLDLFSFNNS